MTAAPALRPPLAQQRGVTLVELMIALALGLLLIGGVISVVVANGQAYRTNEGLSQVQESARTAFELLARDIREAGSTGCGNRNRVANTVNNPGGGWWQGNWTGVRGYDGSAAAPWVTIGTGTADRVDGTDAIQLQGVVGTGLTIESHNPTSANFKINAPTSTFRDGDILLVCDFDHAAVFQVTNYNSSNVTVVHNTGTGTPGNCSKGLGFPTDCGSVTGNEYTFGPNSQIAAMQAVIWYIGNNGRPGEGGRSLYRRRLVTQAGIPTPVAEEIVPGVTDMQLAFRPDEGSATLEISSDISNWDNVTAVEITLTVLSADARISTAANVNDGRLQRSFTTIIGLRNRLP
jgi:type IV pilus assembly protein PilW